MKKKIEHDYKNNGLGAEVCQRCGHFASIPDWPPYCESKDPIAVELGSRGGSETFKRIGKKGMTELSKKAMLSKLAKGQIKKTKFTDN